MKTIMIDDETYEKLKRMKNNRSFSSLLSFLADEARGRAKYNIRKFYGILNKQEAEMWESAISESRNKLRDRL